MPRERATEHVVELLDRICAGGKYLDCITSVHAFGSWSRGAAEVGDVDINVEYDHRLDPDLKSQVLDALVAGRDWNTPLRKALKPRRTLQVLFGSIGMLEEPVLIYQQGDTLGDALGRVNAISMDPAAGKAPRDPVHPSILGVADELSRPSRILLTEMATHGLIDINEVALGDVSAADIHEAGYREFVDAPWGDGSPLARAARAAAAHLLSGGLQPSDLIVLGRSFTHTPETATWAVEAREGKLTARTLKGCFTGGNPRHPPLSGFLYVVRPDRRGPLKALSITAPTDSKLRDCDFDATEWLQQTAPHLYRIG